MGKKGFFVSVLMIFYLNIYGQKIIPLFLKDKNFDIAFEHNHSQGTIVISSYKPFLTEINFSKNTFYLRRDSVIIDSRMQYEYFKIDKDRWLEVKTINKKSTSKHLKILDEVTDKDTIPWVQGYGSGVFIVQYNKLDTLPSQSIIKREIKY